MELFNLIIDGLFSFKAEWPKLSMLLILALVIGLGILFKQDKESPKTYREIFDINARLENPSRVVRNIDGAFYAFLALIGFILSALVIVIIKVYFYSYSLLLKNTAKH